MVEHGTSGHQSGLGAAGGACPRWAPPRQAEPHGLCTSAVLFARCSLAINLPNLPVEHGSGGPMGGDAGKAAVGLCCFLLPSPFPPRCHPGA